MIAIISNKIDQYQNYNFKLNFLKNYKKEINKCFNYNVEDHPQYLMNQFHYQSIKYNYKIDHYENIKNKNKIKLLIFLDVVDHFEIKSKKPKLLIILEYKSIKPFLYERKNHKFFNIVFTFEKNLINKKKYFFYNGLNIIPKKTKFLTKKKIYSKCIFFANKPNNHTGSYFRERIKIINHYRNDAKGLHLYGNNWDRFIVPMNISYFQKIIFYFLKVFVNFVGINRKKYFKIWKGFTNNLIKTTGKYKYCFVIENDSTLSGRIFMTFYAGTVPIYFGDVSKIRSIPKKCYINLKSFKSIDKLDQFINKIDEKKYYKYLNNIKLFLKSKNYQKFTVENDGHNIFSQIKKHI